MDTEVDQKIEVTSIAALWDWLERNASRRTGLWLVTYRKSRSAHFVPRDEVLDALIAFGWMAGRSVTLDDDRSMVHIAPRDRHVWNEKSRASAERLMAEGRMRARGVTSVQIAKDTGMWQTNAEAAEVQAPEDLMSSLAIVGGARAIWDASTVSYRRNVLRWIARAGTQKTRARRIAVVVESFATNTRLPNL